LLCWLLGGLVVSDNNLKRLRITFISPPVSMSGGVKVMAIYAKMLADLGHSVVVVSLPFASISLRQKLKSLLKYRTWPVRKPSISHLDGLGLDHRVLNAHRPIIDKDVPDADVVIATWWETAEWVHALSASKGAKIYFIQGHEIFDFVPKDRCRATYRLPLRKVVIARWLADIMRCEYGDGAVDLVPNSVDHQQFFALPRGKQVRPTLGFLYHKAALKGVGVVLAAVGLLKEKYPNLRVLCFGSHAPDDPAELAGFIEFVESPAQDRIRDIYAQCDVWVTASRSEGFNLPAMEAMACRAPVVATKTGWPEEAISDGVNGYLVDVDDVDGLVQSVSRILELDDVAWHEISEAAFRTVADSTWTKSCAQFEAVLRRACE
jgi:glycosyltransferase involved in cell wall biosynthesis